jgi:hypothetical protein
MTPMLLPSLLLLPFAAPQTPSNLTFVPADALLVSHVDDLAVLRGAIAQHNYTRLITAPDGLFPQQDMSMLRTMLDPKPNAEALAALDEEARQILEIINTLQGGATAYLTQPRRSEDNNDAESPVFGLLLEPREASAEFQARLKEMVKDQKQITFLERGGMEVAVPTRSLVDADAFEAGMIFAPGRFGFVAGDDRVAVKAEFERLLSRLAGGEGAGIDTSAEFQGALRSLKAPGQLSFYMNLGSLVQLGKASFEAQSAALPVPAAAMLDRSGLDSLTFLAARLNVGTVENFDLEVYMPYQEDSLIGMLLSHIGAGTLEHLRRVPADALSVSVGSIDWYGLFEDALSLADEFEEGTGEMARAQLEAVSSMLGFDIEQDLLAQLAGPMVTFTRPLPQSEEQADNPMAAMFAMSQLNASSFLVSVKEPDTVEGALLDLVDFLAAQSGEDFGLVESEVEGARLWRLDAPSQGMELPFAIGFTPAEQSNGIMALGGNAADLANALKDPAGKSSSVLDHEKLGPLLRANVGRGALQVADTAATLEGAKLAFESMLGFSGLEGELDEDPVMKWFMEADAGAIERFLKGTGMQIMELQGGGVRLVYQSR